MKTLQKTIVASMSLALVLTNYAVFAEVAIPIATIKENGNKVATGVTFIKRPAANASPLTGGWIESKNENSSRKLNFYKDGTVSMNAQQGQYSASVKRASDTGNSSLKLGMGSGHCKLSGSVSHSPDAGLSSYGADIGLGHYSGSVKHSPDIGNSSLKLGVGSQYGKFSGTVSRSSGTGNNTYGIGWKTIW